MRQKCKAIGTTFDDNVFTTGEHLHELDTKQLEQLKVFEKMKEKATNSNEQPKKLSKIQQQLLCVSEQWHCQNAKAYPKHSKARGWGNNPTELKGLHFRRFRESNFKYSCDSHTLPLDHSPVEYFKKESGSICLHSNVIDIRETFQINLLKNFKSVNWASEQH